MYALAWSNRIHLQLALGNCATVARIGPRHVHEELNDNRNADDRGYDNGVPRRRTHTSLALASATM